MDEYVFAAAEGLLDSDSALQLEVDTQSISQQFEKVNSNFEEAPVLRGPRWHGRAHTGETLSAHAI